MRKKAAIVRTSTFWIFGQFYHIFHVTLINIIFIVVNIYNIFYFILRLQERDKNKHDKLFRMFCFSTLTQLLFSACLSIFVFNYFILYIYLFIYL